MPFSSDVIEISDSDDDAHPLPPSSSQFSRKSFHGDLVDLASSDDELPAPGDVIFSRGVREAKVAGKRKRYSSPAASSRSSSVDHTAYRAASSDEEESPKKIPRKSNANSSSKAPRRPRKTEEEKAAAKALKEKEAAQKKAQKAAEKAEKAAETARLKAEKKEYMAANKLVNDKKMTLEQMELVFPPALRDSDLLREFRAHIAQFKMTVSVSDRNVVRGCDIFSWQRTMTKNYDAEARQWLPVPQHVRTESTYLVYMQADELARCIRDEDGVKHVVRRVREACGAKTQIFLMVVGLTAYLRRKGGIRYTKGEIERALAALQMAEHTHLLYVDKVEDTVARLYDLSADLGIKPHKHIERSHLPFCSDIRQPTGTSLADTWVKMLEQVHRLTGPGARGIADEFPTAHSLFEAYEQAPDARARDGLVANCKISHRVDGVAKERLVNQALSQVVGTVMYSEDPLQLAYKAAKSK
ncbi:hypothetical protein B0H19DRAFT_1087822 [Mycena capillaripes]|nr:hypothetical protein B0H19DRAFT_1087822 [Mycena capillaripes]